MLLTLTNAPRDYAWGSTTLLAELQGRTPSGAPEAEVWFGDHPGDPAELPDGRTLDEVTGGSLPYLLKLLAAGAPLSIQVHPTRAQAREGYARESALDPADPARNYRDDNHKPELIVALSDTFEALSGLRPVSQTLRLLASFPESAGVAELRRRLGAGTSTDAEAEALRDTIGWLLSGRARAAVADIVAGLAATDAEGFDDALDAIRGIARRNPADPGVVVALLMNFVVLRPGEAIFLRAGLLHAYVSGLGVEIMAASDNVLRGGLTSKHIDVDELLAIVDTRPAEVPVQRRGGAATVYDVPVPDFALRRLEPAGDQTVTVTGPAIVLATAGEVAVSGADARRLPIPVGEAVFATADETRLTLHGHGEVFIAEPGRDGTGR
ncbi:mannose-6-phosphate isomerase, class I [Microbacterium soli]|uniref:mannose-6-phosphate isomerase n=1 Tax=Microbacterium soli TaxID=446075 RepID=A0ABP7MNR0_9MICO